MATLYQKRGNEFVPIEFPAEMISVASEKFQATDTKGALEELESKFSEMYATEGTRQAVFTQEAAQEFTWPWDNVRKGYFRALEVTALADGIIGDMDPDIVTLGADHKTFTVNESGFYFVKVRGAWSFNRENAPEEVMCSIRTPAFNLDLVNSTSGSNASQAWFNNSAIFYFEKGTQAYFELIYPGNYITNPGKAITSVTQSVLVQWVKMPTVNKLEKNKYAGGQFCKWVCDYAHITKHLIGTQKNQIDYITPITPYISSGMEKPTFELMAQGVKILEDGQFSIMVQLFYNKAYSISDPSGQVGAWLCIKNSADEADSIDRVVGYESDAIRTLVYAESPWQVIAPKAILNLKKGQVVTCVVWDNPETVVSVAQIAVQVARIQEPAALSIPDPADYTYDVATGGHRGLIPDIPARDRGILNRPLVSMGGASTNIDVRNVSCAPLDTEADNITGGLSFYNKEGYAKETIEGVGSIKATQWCTIVPNRGANKGPMEGDYFVKTLYSPLSKSHMFTFFENITNGSVGLHWNDPETGVEQINRQIIRLPVGYASVTQQNISDINIANCPVGKLIVWSTGANFAITLPAIGTWDFFIMGHDAISGGLSYFQAGIAAGGTLLFTAKPNNGSSGWARRIQ